ncbi:MAG: type VI secretion system accessory protein TagJ [Planctomycetota bacterium]
MLAEELLRAGKLDDALAELKRQIQSNPSEGKLRVFLFQLLTVLGKWESALNQLEIAGQLDAGNLAMVQAYREAIRCEELRRRVFLGETSPMIFGEPDRWLALLIEAVKMSANGNGSEAQALRDEAFASAPATTGLLHRRDQEPVEFEWIADADPRLGPVLEALIEGQYYWVPFNRIAQIDIEAPSDLRDFVWTPAHFVWSNGGESYGMIPTRYPGSESIVDSAIQLARKTEWNAIGSADDPGQYVGLGQRMFGTDQDEVALHEISKIALQCDTSDADSEPVLEESVSVD